MRTDRGGTSNARQLASVTRSKIVQRKIAASRSAQAFAVEFQSSIRIKLALITWRSRPRVMKTRNDWSEFPSAGRCVGGCMTC